MPILTVKRVMMILLMNRVYSKDNTGFTRDLMISSGMECAFLKYRERCKRGKRCNVRDLRLALPEVGGGGSPHLGVLILSRRSLECQDGWLLLPSDHLLAHSYCRLSLLAPLTHPLGLTDSGQNISHCHCHLFHDSISNID